MKKTTKLKILMAILIVIAIAIILEQLGLYEFISSSILDQITIDNLFRI